jgi:hypothetical protein
MLPLAGTGLASLTPALHRFDDAIPPTLGLLGALRPSLEPAVQSLSSATSAFHDLSLRPCQFSRFLVNWGGPHGLVTFGNGGGGFARFKFVFPEPVFAGAPPTGDAAAPYPSPADCGSARP